MISPTELSLKLLRSKGYTAQVVEHWNAFARIRQDLFGIIDIVAVKEGEWGVLGVQTTSKSNITARLKKAGINKHLLVWYKSGNNFEVHGWGKVKGKWEVEIREVVEKKYLPKKN
jgi:hypothetical protein